MLNLTTLLTQIPTGGAGSGGVLSALEGNLANAGQAGGNILNNLFAGLLDNTGTVSADMAKLLGQPGQDNSATLLQANPQIAAFLQQNNILTRPVAQNTKIDNLVGQAASEASQQKNLDAQLLQQQVKNDLNDLQKLTYNNSNNNQLISNANNSPKSVQEILAAIPNNAFAQQVVDDGQVGPANIASQPQNLKDIANKDLSLAAVTTGVLPKVDENKENGKPENTLVSVAKNTSVFDNDKNDVNKILPRENPNNNFANNSLISSSNNGVLATEISDDAAIDGSIDTSFNGNVHLHTGDIKSGDIAKFEQLTKAGGANYPSPAEQVQLHIANAIKNGDSKIHIQLEPANLGKLDIHIDIPSNGNASITIIADKSDTLDALKNDSRSLEKALQDAGLKANAGSLNFGLRNGEGQQQYTRTDKAYKNAGKLVEEITADVAGKLQNTYLLFSSNRLLDINA